MQGRNTCVKQGRCFLLETSCHFRCMITIPCRAQGSSWRSFPQIKRAEHGFHITRIHVFQRRQELDSASQAYHSYHQKLYWLIALWCSRFRVIVSSNPFETVHSSLFPRHTCFSGTLEHKSVLNNTNIT